MLKVVFAVAVVVVGGVAAAQPRVPASDPEFERAARADVERVSAEAAKAYDEGNAARDAKDVEKAIAGYRRAIELAPSVDHPHRRLCGVLRVQSKLDEALTECEAALKLAPESPWNRSAVAGALIEQGRSETQARAYELARQAADAQPEDLTLTHVWCLASMELANPLASRRCDERLLKLDPDGLLANYLGAIVAANDRDFDEAHVRLRKAKTAGLNQGEFDRLTTLLEKAQEDEEVFPISARTAFWVGVPTLAVWLGVMLLLLFAGTLLSRKTLATVEQTATTKAVDAAGTERERRLRKVYKTVLLLSGLYFYLSIPILLAIVLIGGCGVLLVFWAIGTIPIQLGVLICIVMFGTIGAIFRSLFVRAKFVAPGPPVDFAKHTKLHAVLEEVAKEIGTRPVDVAYLTPGTDMAVVERGSLWASLRGKRTERILIMGIGLFEGMTQLQMRSILAHEYGHFRNADTAGGGFALAVRRSLYALILRLADAGVAGSFNPVWWFLRAFHRMYLGISQGASRLQEVLADRWAIQAYGSAGFVAGYRHVFTRDVAFGHEVDAKIKEVIENEWGLPNLYAYKTETPTAVDVTIADEIEKAMTKQPDVYDSHPSSAQRIRWAEQLAVAGAERADDGAPVWSLFEEREDIERFMTTTVRERVNANRGIEIPATDENDYEDDENPEPSAVAPGS